MKKTTKKVQILYTFIFSSKFTLFMQYSDFSDSKIYLNKLIEYQRQHNFFSHLTNSDKDIYKTITSLYKEDDYQSLFDPIYEKIDNCQIAYTSSIYTLSYGSGVLIDRIWLNGLRTQNYFYVLIIGPKEENYSFPWFKNRIEDLQAFNLNQKALDFLLEKNQINIDNYIHIEEYDLENYDSWNIININIDGDYWANYFKKR